MARKPSASNRGSRTPANVSQGSPARRTSAAHRANDTNRGEAGRTRTEAKEDSRGQRRAATAGRSGRATRRNEEVWTPDQQAATRGRSDRASGQRSGGAGRLAGQPDHGADIEDLRAGGRDGASEQIENRSRITGGLGATETSGERQGMGRGHRRNFDESDDDATTRGQSTADETSETRDSGVRRHSRAMDDPLPRGRPPSRGGRSGRRSDW